MGTILAYREDSKEPHAYLVLANGDQIIVILDNDGVTISKLGEHSRILFEADPGVVSKLCASLVDPNANATPSPLRVLSAILLQLKDADSVESAFGAAAAQV